MIQNLDNFYFNVGLKSRCPIYLHFFAGTVREDTHIFLVVGPLRGGGDPLTIKQKYFFIKIGKTLQEELKKYKNIFYQRLGDFSTLRLEP